MKNRMLLSLLMFTAVIKPIKCAQVIDQNHVNNNNYVTYTHNSCGEVSGSDYNQTLKQ